MSIRLASYAVIPAVFVAGGLALHGVGRAPDAIVVTATTASTRATEEAMLPSENGQNLPPNHPPIGAANSPHGSMPGASTEVPSLVWKMPDGWQTAPSPNAVRLATYLAPGGVEVSVSRAGGATEANIQRWIAQFDNVGREDRVEKTVHGIHVVTVGITGTYVGGGTTMGAPADARPDWAMVGAVIESRGLPYFFKMTGPATTVRAARAAFDRLVDSIAPIGA